MFLAAPFNPFKWPEALILSLQMHLGDFYYYLNYNHLLLFRMQTPYVYLEAGNEWYPSLYDEIRDSEVKTPTTLSHPNSGIMQFCCSHSFVSTSLVCSL